MELTQETPQLLVVERKNSLLRMLPLAIGGAGLLLTLSMMKEYGVQAWYRTPYWLGALIATVSVLVYLLVPQQLSAKFDRKKGKATLQVKRGIRLAHYQQYALSGISSVRVEQAEVRKGDEVQNRYRVSMQVDGQWIPVLPGFRPNLYPHQFLAGKLQAWLNEEDQA